MMERWLAGVASRTAEAIASVHASAACYGRAEDVRILPVVMAELKFREVERQVLLADAVVGPDHATLEKRPEAIKVRGMDFAADVFALGVTHRLVREPESCEVPVPA